MKPSECKDSLDCNKLNETGITFNEWGFGIKPTRAFIYNNTTELRIPMKIMKRFVEWYLEDQTKDKP